MLESSCLEDDSLQKFICGEIYYDTPSVFNVVCSLCKIEMQLEEFPFHFLNKHLSTEEESLSLEILDHEDEDNLEASASPLDDIAHSEEIPVDDFIDENECMQYILSGDSDDNYEDNTCLEELTVKEDTEEQEKLQEVTDLYLDSFRKECDEYDQNLDVKEETSLQTQIFEETHIEIVSSLDNETFSDEDTGLDDIDICEDDQTTNNEELSDIEKPPVNEHDPDKTTKEMLPFPCSECNNSYHTKHGLGVHIRNVHDPNKPPTKPKIRKPPNKCYECDVVCRTSRDLTAHMLKHTGIFCDICGRSFAQTAHLTRHKIRHSGIKNFICEQCNKAFFTAKELKAHMICHSSVMPVICEICGKGCRNETVLNAHMRRHTGERPAKCEVCGKCFFSWHDLKVHAVSHTDERPFECDICGATFQRKKSLRVHKLRHSDNPKHVCQVCGKGFAQSGGLKAHMRTHDAAKIKTETNNGETFEEVVHRLLTSYGDEVSESE